MEELERRTFNVQELRALDDAEERIIEGYAAVFNQLSDPLGGFVEKIRPGAFSRSILIDDVRALFNHNPNYVLGRNKAGTLELIENERGLKIRIKAPDTQWARDLITSIKRGDVSQMSFGFRTLEDVWEHGQEGELKTRELVEVKLFDVSPVTFPAYPQTVVDARTLLAAQSGLEEDCADEDEEEADEQVPLSIRRKQIELLEKEYEV